MALITKAKDKLVSGGGIFTLVRSSISSQISSWVDMGTSFVFFAWVFFALDDFWRSMLSVAVGAAFGGVVNCCLNYRFGPVGQVGGRKVRHGMGRQSVSEHVWHHLAGQSAGTMAVSARYGIHARRCIRHLAPHRVADSVARMEFRVAAQLRLPALVFRPLCDTFHRFFQSAPHPVIRIISHIH